MGNLIDNEYSNFCVWKSDYVGIMRNKQIEKRQIYNNNFQVT